MDNNFNLSQFRIISPELANFSTSEIRVSLTTISFNIATAAELKYPERICLLASDDGTRIGLKPYYGDGCDDMSIPFFNRSDALSNGQRIIIRDKRFVQALREELGWADKAGRKAHGVFYAKAELLLFDLNSAILFSDKSRSYKKPSLRNYPTLQEAMASMQPRVLSLPPAC